MFYITHLIKFSLWCNLYVLQTQFFTLFKTNKYEQEMRKSQKRFDPIYLETVIWPSGVQMNTYP